MTSENATVPVSMQQKTKLYRQLALWGHIGLIAWVAIWHILLTEPRVYSIAFIALIYVLPLCFPLAGVIKGKPYTHAWASFIVLFYMMHAITAWYSVPEQWLYAFIELILSSVMFIGCCVYARLRGQELGLALPKLKEVMAEEKARFEGEEPEDVKSDKNS